MLKLIISDYKMNFKSALKRMSKDGSWFIYIYLLILPITSLNFIRKEEIIYYGVALPLIIGILISRMYPNRISKTLFLCPIAKEGQHQYFVTAFWLRVSIPLLLFVVLDGMLLLFHIVSWYVIMLAFAMLFMFVVSVNIYWDTQDKNQHIEKRKYPLPQGYAVWQKIAQIIGIINMVVLVSAVTDETKIAEWEIVMIAVLMLIQLIIFVKMVTRYFKPVLEIATNYELSYLILSKEDKRQ